MNGIFQQSSPMLKRSEFRITSVGDGVEFMVGNVPILMHYEHAMALSRWMREDAGRAKAALGLARSARVLGVMHDADAKPKRLAPRARGVSIHVKEKRHKFDRRDVSISSPETIAVKIGLHTLTLPLEAALKISQHFRVMAKESARRAGDVRHWSEIGILEG